MDFVLPSLASTINKIILRCQKMEKSLKRQEFEGRNWSNKNRPHILSNAPIWKLATIYIQDVNINYISFCWREE